MFEIILVVSLEKKLKMFTCYIMSQKKQQRTKTDIAICNRVTQVGDLQMGYVYKHT